MENLVNYRDNTYKLGGFLKQQFPGVKFLWDEDSKGWWTTDERFLNKYSSERTTYNYNAEKKLKRVFSSQNYGQKLIVNSDFDKIQLTLDQKNYLKSIDESIDKRNFSL